jgi:superfamily I DNA and/or RNA helicase
MVYVIRDLISSAALSTRSLKSEYLEAAVNLVKNSIKDGGISLIQGPPGTGKTTVFELAINDLFDMISSEEYLLLYEAPTNKLVADMLQRVAAIYSKKGKISALTQEVRVYGSQFDYRGYEEMASKVDPTVKIILSTDYQRPYFATAKQLCLLIDEASKTPLHQPFIPFTGKIIEMVGRPEMYCISVVGDPKQAITLGHHYRDEGENLLILNSLIKGHLKRKGVEVSESEDLTESARRCLSGDVFEFLSFTHRMPHPTEVAVSKAYYGGWLHSTTTVKERLKNAWDRTTASRLSVINEKFNKAVKIAEEAITTSRGIIYVKIDQDYPYGEEENAFLFEPKRAEAGIYLATCLSSITYMKSAVLTTYTDQWQQMKLMFQRDLVPHVKSIVPEIKELVSFGTVDRQLGSEEEIVVCVLGKERCKKDNLTRYFNEPELLNVQLTRHRRLLCIVGNLLKLRNTARKLNSELKTLKFGEVAEVSEALMEQAGFEIRKRTAQRIRTGDVCVFSEWF